jgi:hypothetical protein
MDREHKTKYRNAKDKLCDFFRNLTQMNDIIAKSHKSESVGVKSPKLKGYENVPF